ncbi:hypothetical protein VKS41_008240 [Umbelopsis sp. WA50703]|jgi:hypothetical protein
MYDLALLRARLGDHDCLDAVPKYELPLVPEKSAKFPFGRSWMVFNGGVPRGSAEDDMGGVYVNDDFLW